MTRKDDALWKRALAALCADDRLDAANLHLEIDARDGLVELTGSVVHPWQKFYAERVLEGVPGVQQVANLSLVEPVAARTDDEIMEKIVGACLQDPYLRACIVRPEIEDAALERAVREAEQACVIRPEVEEGVVYLRGRVPSLVRKRLAGVLAWWVDGVRDVVNDLDVDPPEADGNEQLADALKVVLEKDPLVDASTVAVHVSGHGEVMLSGTVRSPEQRQAAENDAWCVLGVQNVTNDLYLVPAATAEDRLEPAGR